MGLEERIFNSKKEIEDFLEEAQKNGWILEGCPWYEENSQAHREDSVNMRIYRKPNSSERIRIVYPPNIEWEPSIVKYK